MSGQSPLAEDLAAAEAIKAAMTEQLRELEEKATGKTVTTVGAWRHRRPDTPKKPEAT